MPREKEASTGPTQTASGRGRSRSRSRQHAESGPAQATQDRPTGRREGHRYSRLLSAVCRPSRTNYSFSIGRAENWARQMAFKGALACSEKREEMRPTAEPRFAKYGCGAARPMGWKETAKGQEQAPKAWIERHSTCGADSGRARSEGRVNSQQQQLSKSEREKIRAPSAVTRSHLPPSPTRTAATVILARAGQ